MTATTTTGWWLTIEWTERHHGIEYRYAHQLGPYDREETACRERERIVLGQSCPSRHGYAIDCHGPVQA